MYFLVFCLSVVWITTCQTLCPEIVDINCNCTNKGKPDKIKLKCFIVQKIEDLSFHKPGNSYLNISQLDLSNNNITNLPADAFFLPKLIRLDLERNSIRTIEKGAFSKLENLKQLLLSNNKLETINKGIFEGLKSLETLKLAKNFLTTIPRDTFENLPKLSQINLIGNPFFCDCDIWWLRTSILKFDPVPKCELPPFLNGQSMNKTTDKECNWNRPVPVLHLEPENNQIVFEGDSFALTCEIDEGTDEYTGKIVWTCDNKEALELFRESVRIDRNSLFVDKLEGEHGCEWSCSFISPTFNKTLSIFVAVVTKETVLCEMTVTETNKGRYIWPETISGQKVSLPCQVENAKVAFPYATHTCSTNGTWAELNTNNCPFTSNITRILQESSKMNLTQERNSLIDSALSLRKFISENLLNIANVIDIHFLIVTLENYMMYLEKEQDLGTYLVDIVNLILKFPRSVLDKAQRQHMVCSRLISVIQNIMRCTAGSYYQTEELTLHSLSLPTTPYLGLSCYWIKTNKPEIAFHLNCSTTLDKSTSIVVLDFEASFQLPANLFHSVDENVAHSLTNYVMVAGFKDSRLFPDRSNAKEDNNPVLALNLVDFKIVKLDKPIYFKIRNNKLNLTPSLACWDLDAAMWKKNCCTLLSSNLNTSRNAFVSYNCFKFGYFSLIYDSDDGFSAEDGVIGTATFSFLHPSIYVGTFVSVTCLLLASLSYWCCYSHIQMTKKMKHSLTNTWLSTSLFYLIFSIGIHQTDQPELCRYIGLSIHYFLLCTLFWMAVTIKDLYKRVQKSNPSVSTPSEDLPSSDVSIQKPILGLYMVGWGISTIICGIAGAVNLKGYCSPHYCFLTLGPELSTVFIPACLVLFYLLIMTLLVRCATGSPDSNPQLSVGTQAIDLELLDSGGRNSFTQERCSVRSITTPSSQAEDTEHSPARQLKAFTIYLAFYLMSAVYAACYVMRPMRWSYEEKVFSFAYALVSVLLGSFVIFFHCFARNDIRSAWSNFLEERRFRKSPHIIANSLISPISFRTNNGNEPITSKPPSDNNSTKSDFLKQTPNINLVRLHRQHYRDYVKADGNFYNPHQSFAAKKFFKKQRRKRNTLRIRKCRSGGSSPVSGGLFEDSAKATGTRTEDENTKFLNSNEHFDEFSSEKHPLTYDEPDITEGKTGTESEATFTVPEYAEIQEHSVKYEAPSYLLTCNTCDTKEQMCGTSDRDWCSCDAVSDVNSEPTYHYAYIKNGYGSSRSAVSDNSSINSHLYTTVPPDIVNSVDRQRRRSKCRQAVKTSSHTVALAATNDFKRRRKNILPSEFSSQDKVETYIKRTAC